MDYYKESLKMHEEHRGKTAVASKVSVKTRDDLSTAYTPGVAEPCRRIKAEPDDVYRYTNKSNTVAVVSDGSAVLGLGNIGGLASIPVMDGKSLLFKEFAGIDAIPVCLQTQDTDEIVNIVKNISPTLGGVNLEDISAPRCFEVEEKLQAEVDIPVFHDDQHGTAVVVSSGVINAAKVMGRELSYIKAVVNGIGAAGTAIIKMLLNLGIKDIIACDIDGILTKDRPDMNRYLAQIADATNRDQIHGTLADAVKGRDLFIGVSAARVLTPEMVKTMADDPVIFAMANPEPEILPELAAEAGAAIIGTGRSDHPNQINNVLIFPGLFKGALSVRAKRITEKMKTEAAFALAGLIPDDELARDNIIPSAFHPDAADTVAEAVARAWKEEE